MYIVQRELSSVAQQEALKSVLYIYVRKTVRRNEKLYCFGIAHF
jgi:hypothetical protein